MSKKNKSKNAAETGNDLLADVSGSYYDKEGWEALGIDEGEGSECCGKNMVELMCTYTCLKCGNWEYSSS